MKRLYLVRHAKSDWSYAGLADFDRPLNKRGKRDAPRMGKYLKRVWKVEPDCAARPSACALRSSDCASLSIFPKNGLHGTSAFIRGIVEMCWI